MVFDMRKDKMLFVFKQYKHDDNKVLLSENLSFLSITSFNNIKRSLKFTVKNKLNEKSFNMNSSKDIKKKSTSTLRALKEKMI